MLKPENRLKKVRDFNLLMKQGRWINGEFLDLKILNLNKIPLKLLPKRVEENEFRKQLKIAFTIGLKIDKRAVVRNRLRRQLREAVRLFIKDNKLKEGNYLLFVARKDMKNQEYKAIHQEAEGLLGKAGIFIK